MQDLFAVELLINGPLKLRFMSIRIIIEKALQENLYGSFNRLEEQKIVNAFAGVTLPNDKSVAFHESMGFEKIGVYKNMGYKFDQWWDVKVGAALIKGNP